MIPQQVAAQFPQDSMKLTQEEIIRHSTFRYAVLVSQLIEFGNVFLKLYVQFEVPFMHALYVSGPPLQRSMKTVASHTSPGFSAHLFSYFP
jgi:hypothetical protein